MSHVLLIDDETQQIEMVSSYLRKNGFEVDRAATLAQGRESLRNRTYDVLLLGPKLTEGPVLDFIRELRGQARTRRLPLIMLSARSEPIDGVVTLEVGADDFLPRPFELRELLARVKAQLRRTAMRQETQDGDLLRFGRLEIDLGARQVRLEGKQCELTRHQFDLLALLARNPGRVLSRDYIMELLRGGVMDAFDRSIDVHISRIRSVIEDDPREPKRVLTVRGAGYLFPRTQDAELGPVAGFVLGARDNPRRAREHRPPRR